MPPAINAPALFFAPFVSSALRIEAHDSDARGILRASGYHRLFDHAVEEAFALIGLGADEVTRRGGAFVAAANRETFERDLSAGDRVRVTLNLIDFNDSQAHFYMEMREAREGWLAAASERTARHLSLTERREMNFPPDIIANLALMKAAHAQLPRPIVVGAPVGLPRKRKVRTPEDASGTRH